MYYRLFAKLYQRAARKMCRQCQGFIKNGAKILDLGCGSAIAGKEFQDFFKAELWGVDIIDKRVVDIPFQIINGKNLPFSDNFFDVVLISYVLHHSQDPISLLKEAKRVSKKIIIFEDLPEGLFSRMTCQIHQISFDKFFKNPNKTSFKTKKEWERIFEELGLKVIFQNRIHNFPAKKGLFILEKRT